VLANGAEASAEYAGRSSAVLARFVHSWSEASRSEALVFLLACQSRSRRVGHLRADRPEFPHSLACLGPPRWAAQRRVRVGTSHRWLSRPMKHH
jgi:hypothetical protein